ncbi:metallophosphoesterase family protein [Azospirillum griseum]|uniref:Metallophosphoesterase n=1 Tax=Azospirillum griseum TaxID=2496639 RepID=A0A3S0JFX3_9PROT|nr:metallophosphoesterase [Azospirillum griseum]RTR17072.1 metallophosphoesterase [Azospirillum griseum]
MDSLSTDGSILTDVFQDSIHILHVSDFHLTNPEDPEQTAAIQTLIAAVKQDTVTGLDAVMVTGDIATGGAADAYLRFKSLVVDALIQAQPDRPPAFFIVPGNHDHDFSQYPAGYTFPLNAFQKYIDNSPPNSTRDTLSLPLLNFQNCLPSPGWDSTTQPKSPPSSGDHWLKAEGSFSRLLQLPGGRLTLAVVGLNTNWLLDPKGSAASLRRLNPGVSLLRGQLAAAKGADHRLVLGHHPLSWFAPDVEQQVKAILREHKAIYLHGHQHAGDGQFDIRRNGVCVTLQARAAHFGSRNTGPTVARDALGGYTLLTFRATGDTFRVRPRIVLSSGVRLDDQAFPEDPLEGPDFFEFPLPNTQAFQAWLDPLGDSWVLEEDNATPVSVNAQRLRCYLTGTAPDLAVALRLPGAPNPLAAEAVRQLEPSNACGQHAPVTAWIETPYGEGRSTAILQATAELRGTGKWAVYRHRSGQPLRKFPFARALRENANRQILLVIEQASRHAHEVSGLLDDARALAEVDRISFLLGSNPLERDALRASGTAPSLFSDPPDWQHGCSLHLGSWLIGAQGIGLTSVEAGRMKRAFADDPRMSGNASWLGGLLALDEATDGRWSVHKNRGRAFVDAVQSTLSNHPVLADALALVAALHARVGTAPSNRGEPFLERRVLAQALFGAPDTARLEREVLSVLQSEIQRKPRQDSEVFVLRHWRIAQLYRQHLKARWTKSEETLLDAALALQASGETVPFWDDWIDLAAELNRLPDLDRVTDWAQRPNSSAVIFADHCRWQNDLRPLGLRALTNALSSAPDRPDHRAAFAMFARLTVWSTVSRTDLSAVDLSHAALAALAALRNDGTPDQTIKREVYEIAFDALDKLAQGSYLTTPASELNALRCDRIDRVGGASINPARTFAKLANQFSGRSLSAPLAGLGDPGRWRFPDPFRVG